MTNPNYYYHQKQEDATKATTAMIVAKTTNTHSNSQMRSTDPNKISGSPTSCNENSIRNSNPSSTRNTVKTNNHDSAGSEGISEMDHRFHNSAPLNTRSFSRDPLSPQSAPPTTSLSGFAAPFPTETTPVPSVIHADVEVHGESMARAKTHGSTPYIPSMTKSSSASALGTGNLLSKKGSTKVTGKKRHQNSKPKSGNTTLTKATSSPRPHDGGGNAAATSSGQKKQRRLERNRLSAQLSRRRRKQYLEELEDRVVRLSLDMDLGRRAHASQAISRILEIRQQALESAERVVREIESSLHSSDMSNKDKTMMLQYQLDNYLRLLENAGPLSRTNSEELLILNSFLGQQLKSFSLPSHSKFILWLSLQGDTYYRGGRAASERLSAARIGERMLASGNDKVTPTNAMWPLVCNEVGLSYELEERLRVYQRTAILQEKNTWLDRHTARSSALAMQSLHDSIGGMAQMVGDRSSTMTNPILSPSQRVKLLAWARQNSNRIRARLQARRERALRQKEEESKNKPACIDENHIDIGTYIDPKYQLNKTYHLAAKLYILNHQLSGVLKDFPYRSPSILTPPVLKKLMRRASFESLGQQKDTDTRSIAREDSSISSSSMKSLPSNGSLLKSTSNLSLGTDLERPVQITPQVGEQAAVELVDQALGFVKPIIPPIPKPTIQVVSNVHLPAHLVGNNTGAVPMQDVSSSMAIDYHGHQYVPAPVASFGAPVQLAPAVLPNYQVPPTPQYEGAVSHHYSNHPQTQLSTQHYPAPHTQPHTSHIQQANHPYQQSQAEHYFPPQQQVHYTPAPTVSAHQQQVTSMDHSVPVYDASSSENQHTSPPTNKKHERKSSFLPPHLNVVPEDMFPGVQGTAADFIELQDCLMDGDDWGIGIGLDMEISR